MWCPTCARVRDTYVDEENGRTCCKTCQRVLIADGKEDG